MSKMLKAGLILLATALLSAAVALTPRGSERSLLQIVSMQGKEYALVPIVTGGAGVQREGRLTMPQRRQGQLQASFGSRQPWQPARRGGAGSSLFGPGDPPMPINDWDYYDVRIPHPNSSQSCQHPSRQRGYPPSSPLRHRRRTCRHPKALLPPPSHPFPPPLLPNHDTIERPCRQPEPLSSIITCCNRKLTARRICIAGVTHIVVCWQATPGSNVFFYNHVGTLPPSGMDDNPSVPCECPTCLLPSFGQLAVTVDEHGHQQRPESRPVRFVS